MLFHSCNGFKGWDSPTQVDSDWCLYSPKERKQNSTCHSVQHYRVTYHPQKREKVAQLQAANEVPQPHLRPGTLQSLETPENPKPSLSVEEHKEKLMATLDLLGLDQWPEEKAGCARELLMEYHDIFSLDDNELGCASEVKHNIKVTNDEPFKEQF